MIIWGECVAQWVRLWSQIFRVVTECNSASTIFWEAWIHVSCLWIFPAVQTHTFGKLESLNYPECDYAMWSNGIQSSPSCALCFLGYALSSLWPCAGEAVEDRWLHTMQKNSIRVENNSACSLQIQTQQTQVQISSEFDKLRQFLAEEEARRIAELKSEEEEKKQKMKSRISELNKDISKLSELLQSIKREMGAEDLTFLQVWDLFAYLARIDITRI